MIRESLSHRIFNTLRKVYLASCTLSLLNGLVSSLKNGFLNSGLVRILNQPVNRRLGSCRQLTEAVGNHYGNSRISGILGSLEGILAESFTKSLFYRWLVEGERVDEKKPL